MAIRAFERAGNDMIANVAAALDSFGEIVLAESLEQCPVETGTLKRSARLIPTSTQVAGDIASTGQFRGGGGRFAGKAAPMDGKEITIIGYGFGDEVNEKTHRTADEYAEAVHERIEVYHEPPTKAKFLEDPVLGNAARMEPYLAAAMKMGIAGNFSVGAIIQGNSDLVGKNAGEKPNSALDAGDHPKGYPHE